MNLISFENIAFQSPGINSSGETISGINLSINRDQILHLVCANLERRRSINNLIHETFPRMGFAQAR